MVIETLWIKVSDEVSLPGVLQPSEAARLEQVFSLSDENSPWGTALRSLGLNSYASGGSAIRVVSGVPFFNATLLSRALSHGCTIPTRGEGEKILYAKTFSLFAPFRSLRTQWLLEKILSSLDEKEESGLPQEKIEESLTLALAVQSLLLRLPSRSETELGSWLANPQQAPLLARNTLSQILKVQARRNRLSSGWNSLWESSSQRLSSPVLPDHFWNEPPSSQLTRQEASASSESIWRGVPIASGVVEGNLVIVEKFPFPQSQVPSSPSVFLFPKAHPDSTLLFPFASAVLFAEGGALSHACCVAREQNLTCVSGLGKSFLASAKLRVREPVPCRVRVDGNSGELKFLSEL